MMVGRFSISAINSWTPAATSCGIAPITASITLEIICGIAATMVVMIVGRF